jgi:hypothetical protein
MDNELTRALNEQTWARFICEKVMSDLEAVQAKSTFLKAEAGRKLPYTSEIYSYDNSHHPRSRTTSYETDLLISDFSRSGESIPRVVIECKLRRITTHEALTYSAQAATHKHVHPYLRYGILIAAREYSAIPGRLVRHGAHFDFMIAWRTTKPSSSEWKTFVAVLADEARASRKMQALLENARRIDRIKYHLVHRRLRLRQYGSTFKASLARAANRPASGMSVLGNTGRNFLQPGMA